jgi:nucleotide-binding universal stress UspA family protein
MATAYQATTQNQLKIHKIAVLTDFSPNARTALRFAAAIARRYGASVLLAHAYMQSSCAFAAPDGALVFKALEDERHRLQTQLINETRSAFLQSVKCTVHVHMGIPKDLLKELGHTDLIVVGTSGETGFGKATLGSTAETIFRSSSVPVLTVGPHCDCPAAEETAFTTVLYATDLSAGAAPALPYALSIAQKHGARLVLLHVASAEDSAFSFDRSMASEAPLEALHKLVADTTDGKLQPMYIVGFGRPDAVINAEARKLKASLIVVGAGGASGYSSLVSHLDGGTAYRVAAIAECPVLTIPKP